MPTKHSGSSRLYAGLGVFVTSLTMLAATATPAFADVSQVSGSAFGENVNNVSALGLVGVNSPAQPTVTLPATGSATPITSSLATVTVPPVLGTVLSTGLLNVSTQGTTGPSGSSTGSASTASAKALTGLTTPLTPFLTADLIKSTCTANGTGASGTTTLTNATLNGATVVNLSPTPNTTLLNLPGVAKVVANEQTSAAGDPNITVNAIHIYLLTPSGLASGDIVISQSHCDVVNSPPTPISEVSRSVIFPAAALGLFGMGAVLMWRRRRTTDIAA